MKHFSFIFLFIMLFVGCKEQIKVNFDIKEGKPLSEVTLYMTDSTLQIPLDSNGSAKCSLVLDKKHFGYGRLMYGFSQVYLFFYKDFDCSVALRPLKSEAEFSGEGKLLNEFVTLLDVVPEEVYKLDEQEFLNKINERYARSLKRMEEIDFPEEFERIERIRQKLFDAYVVHNYPLLHSSLTKQEITSLSPAYYELLESYLIDDPAVLKNLQSQSRLLETVQKTAVIKKKNLKTTREELEVKVNFVLEKFSDPSIRSFLVQSLITNYTERYGTDRLGGLKDTFDQVVTDSEAKRKLEVLYSQSQKIRPGIPSPEFSYKDINDKVVSLKSLRGKYVYIDVWATWCGPCCKEIPHLAELENKYKNKNIHFVSISVDKNRNDWQRMVREKNMKGIQLHAGNDQSFSESYMITSIPRFILLDSEGRIVHAKMTKPSDPQTIQILDGLQGL